MLKCKCLSPTCLLDMCPFEHVMLLFYCEDEDDFASAGGEETWGQEGEGLLSILFGFLYISSYAEQLMNFFSFDHSSSQIFDHN